MMLFSLVFLALLGLSNAGEGDLVVYCHNGRIARKGNRPKAIAVCTEAGEGCAINNVRVVGGELQRTEMRVKGVELRCVRDKVSSVNKVVNTQTATKYPVTDRHAQLIADRHVREKAKLVADRLKLVLELQNKAKLRREAEARQLEAARKEVERKARFLAIAKKYAANKRLKEQEELRVALAKRQSDLAERQKRLERIASINHEMQERIARLLRERQIQAKRNSGLLVRNTELLGDVNQLKSDKRKLQGDLERQSILKARLAGSREEAEEAKRRMAILGGKLNKVAQAKALADQINLGLLKQNAKIKAEKDAIKALHDTVTAEKGQLNNKVTNLEADKTQLTDTNEKLTGDLAAKDTQLNEKESQLRENEAKLAGQNAALKEHEEAAKRSQALLAKLTSEKDQAKLHKELADQLKATAEQATEDAKKEAAEAQTLLANVQQEKTALTTELATAKTANDGLATANDGLTTENDGLKNDKAALTLEKDAFETELVALRAKLAASENKGERETERITGLVEQMSTTENFAPANPIPTENPCESQYGQNLAASRKLWAQLVEKYQEILNQQTSLDLAEAEQSGLALDQEDNTGVDVKRKNLLRTAAEFGTVDEEYKLLMASSIAWGQDVQEKFTFATKFVGVLSKTVEEIKTKSTIKLAEDTGESVEVALKPLKIPETGEQEVEEA